MKINKINNNINYKYHTPVMLKEVLEFLNLKNNSTVLYATFGAGGYSRAILDYYSDCKVIGSDRDTNVEKFVNIFKQEYKERFNFINSKFSEIKNNFDSNSFDGIVLDLGVSSMQIDDAERGFSFNKEAPLNMTMGKNDFNAYDVVNSFNEEKLAFIIKNYGEEIKSKIIAKKIVEYRKNKTIETTTELAKIIHSCFCKRSKIDNATKTFQAIRIFVNDELKELEILLNDSIELLKSGGRLVIVSFHSLEDRIVKNFFKKFGDLKKEKVNKYSNQIETKSIFNIITKKPVLVSNKEATINPRSRSAKLRYAIKC